MRATSIKQKARAFSFLELLAVVAIVAILAALLLPRNTGHPKPTWLWCMSNLKQVGLDMLVFAGDHKNQFPMQTTISDEGSMEFVGTGSPAPHFQTVSNYLSGNWGALLCPDDKSKQRATNHAVLTDRNISYFLSMDVTYGRPGIILAGDRNLEAAGQPVKPGLFLLTTNAAVSWTGALHSHGEPVMRGNLLLADGHVETVRRNLPEVIQRQNLATNRLALP
jgi:prepilin-type N-terminal cleavage/methylation domain-containing protein/prepilin-type processing-associated H-X9-DG protein